ncbi:hypothetical protein ZIOFF_065707 [Zingiber officinale]|uniref:Uncharacterized protein n=1 Tax=Zingiber officinale TaxID=94328 RepID=A0A8J5EXW0_ZINOF|nr:hypothetical protein ZIOFF_065707 [Zingiber officinale]
MQPVSVCSLIFAMGPKTSSCPFEFPLDLGKLYPLSADLLMSVVAEKAEPLTASSSSLEVDPLLKDLTEKKLIFKKNVATLAAELKDVRRRLVLQEQSFAKEAHARKCPQCSKKFRRKEIVNLYAPVIVVPNADLEKEVQCLKKENMSLKIESELELHEARVMGIDGSSHIVIVSRKSPGIEREHVLDKVGWDESTFGERQPRVSLWEIEPLTTFPMYPSSFPLRLKRPWPSDLPSLHEVLEPTADTETKAAAGMLGRAEVDKHPAILEMPDEKTLQHNTL